MKNLETVFENNKEWIKSKLAEDDAYFDKLASGQSPSILYIGCSDSRATAEEIMGLGPGEVFVHRNIANMVSNTDISALGVTNYAVKHLGVDHIVICGHYGCGGVKAAMGNSDLGILNPYLRNIRDVYRTHKKELSAISNEDKRYERLIELNVQEQVVNMLKNEDVQAAYKSRGIKIHGWVFDLASGKLIDLKVDVDKLIKEEMDIYQVS
ncbi:carbonic anhydrase [Nonlabens ponticola]|uniref:Carbonic anhydrase 2 n=1 Tax=Nonlabens ponticola TaxID=2496866 RepID=A0A3S9MYJ3_9FLAO|nr:carbonic anhydrase [Nonlabens ponticola]AZQ44228.1 carbonic anhydrase [Nonlabens ponticola]